MIIKKFEEAVERNPGKEAIKTNNQTLTYAELNFYANRVAHSIAREDKANGSGAEKSQVALLFDYGIIMISGALGALKANKAYVPLDISYPGKRLLYILENSETYLILTDNNNLPLARELSDHADNKIGIINIETIGDEIPGSPIEREVSEDRTAYILYTSGSTGKPKGVFQIHRNVLYYTRNWIKRFSITESDRMSLFTSFTHDGAVQDIFSALLSGALLYPYSMKQTGSVDEFYRLMAEEKLTVWHSVPSLYRYFASTLTANDRFTSVRWVLLGGEPLRAHDLELYKTFFPNANFANVYGQTESSVTGICAINMENTFDDISLGEPLDETKILLLDEDGDVVEEMGGGEIVVDCDYIAPGYWKDKENTEKVFLHDEKRGSLYRTGDMGRFTVRGSIKVLGRKDFQVKIRGFRIELGEIETELLRHYAIKEAIVIARPDENNDTYLCAYIVPGQSVDAEDLREYLSSELPDYMTPRHFIFMEKMPLNSSGKIDRMRLPEPEKVIGSQSVYAAPTNEIEEKVAEIWQKVLKVEKIGINDNFTELGGHSLMIISIISKIHQVFNVELRLTDLFENPTIKQLSRLIMESKQTVFSSIEPIEEKEYYGVTSNQKSMLILNQFEGIGTTYNLSLALKLEGDIDVSRIEEIFRELVDRQESFRTSFRMIDNEWVQVIHREVDFGVQHIDNDNFDIKKIKKSFIQPFDLEKAPSIRVGIATLSANECLLIIDTHHIISDGASGGILSREFSRLYSGEHLPGFRLSYKDYSEWQSDFKKTDSFKLQEQYWLDMYKNDIPVLELPIDFPRPPIQSFEGGFVEFDIEKEMIDLLTRMVKEKGVTPFMVLLAMYNVLLHKYTNQEDIIIGTIISGRPHVDLENIVGFFAQTLALRNRPAPDISFTLFLEELKENTLKAYENQMYPFNELTQKLDLPYDLTRNPLFDTAFVVLNADMSPSGQASNNIGIKATIVGDPADTSIFDISFVVFEAEGKISLIYKYNKKLFKKETIDRFVIYFKKIVSIVLKDPGIKLSEIEIITEEEKKRILFDFNDTHADYPKDKTIHRLFEDQVDKNPEHIALAFDDKMVTYREFDERANSLAHYLIEEKGVCVGDRVAVLMDRSIELIITLMGILKSGGAYLPINPKNPQERIDFMIKDSNTKIIIDKSSLPTRGRVPFFQESTVAYIMYTSGSSGTPKGVLVEHRTIVNTLDWRRRYYEYGPDNVSLQIPPYYFDSSVTDIFTPLLGGARLILIKEEERADIEALKRIIQKNKVSHFIVVPVFYNVMLEEIHEYLKGVKMITCAGDNFPDELIRKHFERLPNVRIFNEYGPTENSVNTSAYELKPDSPKALIGKPINNVQIYILDRNMNITPIGVMGEICLAGSSLAVGYLNRPELTNEKFPSARGGVKVINNPKPKTQNPKLYCAGDLARWLEDGNIEFLGRKDQQIKIRGIRIETGEIENQLMKCEGIKEVIVLARENAEGEKYLCAYIVTNSKEPLSDTDLRRYLLERLPEYMIPSYFIEIESIPTQSNGKINKELLPAPKISKEAHTAPRNRIEEKLAEIWGEILATPKETISIDTDFFKLGGHSLKATIVASRAHKAFNVKLPLTEIFKAPTIRGISKYINNANQERYASIEPVEEREYYPLSSAQKRLFILNRMNPNSAAYNMPQVIPLSMEIDIEKLESTFKELIRRHESLRTSFEMIEGEPAQRIHDDVEFEIDYQDFLTERTEPAERGLRPFDLKKAPLMRVSLIRNEEKKYTMIVDMNHIITDGFSQAILAKEFNIIYGGREEELAPLRLQYKDYARWQKDESNLELMKEQETFWLNLFPGEIPALNLPTDNPRPIAQSFEGESEYFTLDETITHKLNRYAREEGITLYIVLLGAVNILLSRMSGQEDIIIGTPTAGRRHADLEKIIGMFVNTIALRNLPKGDQTITEFINAVKERTLESFENQEYQFEDLVEKLDIKRDPGRNPIFDVMVVLQNIGEPGAERAGEGYKIETMKFDLSITAEETTRGLGVSFQYCVKLFKKETIRRYMSYFKEIITGVLESPEKKIYQIDIIPGEEKNRLLVEFNDSETEYPKDKTIHRLFEEQEEQTPDHIAIVGSSGQITYRELNEKSNSLARELKEKGIGLGDIVGIKMERSIEMIVAMLGILKAGGAYLPIALNYPQDRIDYMLKDSRAKLLITTDNFKEFPNFHLLPATGNRQPMTSLAYIIFTSGSTGRPKGVVIEHRNVVRLVKNPSFIETKEGQRLLMTGQYTFDIVTFEIWWPLLNGLILIQANENTVLNPDEMEKTVIINRIDILHLVPQLFKPMYTHNPGIFGRLSYFLVGGDLVAPREIRDLRKRYEKLKILHMYGPTEGATFSTCLEVGKSDESDRSLPIGKPVNNTTIYILGSHEEILPIGVVGELCVGGAGVAPGYLNNPEMTAERFINPKLFVNTNSLYKTGDLARWLDDGNIEFLGRKDYQVKIRGIRVELGEIESHLMSHDGIKEVVVVDRNENGRQYLCGYFVKELGAGEGKRWVEELKETLEGKLPPYMIPACFVEIDKIPLNANGKVDRKALPQPLEYDFHTGGKYEAPVNDLQRIIAEIWQDVLGREKVGIQDNFFDIGGNSLDFVKVGSKLKEKLNEEIAVVTLFTYPTISSLAHYLSRDQENEPENQRSQEIETLIDEGKGLIFQTLRKRDEGDSYE